MHRREKRCILCLPSYKRRGKAVRLLRTLREPPELPELSLNEEDEYKYE